MCIILQSNETDTLLLWYSICKNHVPVLGVYSNNEAHAKFLLPSGAFLVSVIAPSVVDMQITSFENNNDSYSKLTVIQLKLKLLKCNTPTERRRHDLIER